MDELLNYYPKTLGELSRQARRAQRRIRRRPTLVTAFWKQAELFDKVTILYKASPDAAGTRLWFVCLAPSP